MPEDRIKAAGEIVAHLHEVYDDPLYIDILKLVDEGPIKYQNLISKFKQDPAIIRDYLRKLEKYEFINFQSNNTYNITYKGRIALNENVKQFYQDLMRRIIDLMGEFPKIL